MGILRRGIVAALTASVLLFSGAASASAADSIVAEDECCTFAPGPYYQDLGEIPTFENPVASNAPHNVTSTAKGPDGGALFRSKTIGADDSTPVAGTQYLGAGTYPFYCTLHGLSMSGDLIVEDGKGEVVARPSVKVSIPGQKLKKVRKSGRLKVRLKANTAGSGIKVIARRGKKKLASASKISLSAGKSLTVKLKLTKAGRKAASRGRKVAVSAVASVAFGKSSSAKRKLR